jgi:hypothetical protein
MVQPINYLAQMPQIDINKGFLESIQGAALLGQIQQRRQESLQKAIETQQAEQRLQSYRGELENAYTQGTPDAFLRVMTLFPEHQKIIEPQWSALDKKRQQAELDQASPVMSALFVGNAKVAKNLLQQRIDATPEGQDVSGLQSLVDAIDRDPKAATVQAMDMFSRVMSPEKYAETFSKMMEAKRAEEMSPAELAAKQRQNVPTAIQEAIDYRNLTQEQQQTFQTLQVLKKPPAAVTNVNVTNLEKTASSELAKLLPDLYEQGNSAASQLQDIPRYRKALESAIVGPLADTRFGAARYANLFGFTGDNAVVATRELVQGLSEMALKSRSSLTGQGQITEGEQKLLIKARSGDIDFTKGEMEAIFNVADRAARSQYEKSRKLLKSAAGKSETAAMFLENMSELPQATAPATKAQPAQPAQAAGGFTVTAPNGQSFTFPTKQAADQFRQAAGIR